MRQIIRYPKGGVSLSSSGTTRVDFLLLVWIVMMISGFALTGKAATYTWDGSSSTSWTTGANWTGNTAPTDLATDAIIIPSGCPNYPDLGTTTGRRVGDFTINSGGSISLGFVMSGVRLEVNGNFVNNGTLKHYGTQYIWLMGASKTIGGSGNFLGDVSAPFMFRDGSSYTLTNSLTIRHVFITNTASFDLNGFNLTLEFFFQIGTFYLRTGTLSIGGPADASMWYNSNSYYGGAPGDTYNPYFTDAKFNEATGLVYYNAGETFAADDQQVRSLSYYALKIRTNNGFNTTIGYNVAMTVASDLTIINPGTAGGAATTLNDITLNGNFYLGNTGNGLTLNLADRIARSAAGTGTFTMGNVDEHQVNVTYAHATNWAISLGAAGVTTPLTFYGTVTYNSGSAQKVMNPNYKNLTIAGAGSRTLTANTVITGDLTITGGTLDATASNFNETIGGDFYNVATFTPQSNIVTFNGSIAQSITNASGAASTSSQSITGSVSIADNTPSTGVAATNTVPTAAALASSGGAMLSVIMPGGVYQSLKSINLSATHPNNADLDFYLVTPDNTVLLISTDNGGTGDNYSNVTFSDAGAAVPSTANTNFSAITCKPEGVTFASYTGTLAGTWKLYAIDDAAANTGTLTDFTVTLNVIPEATLNLYNLVIDNSSTGVTTNNDISINAAATVTLTRGAFYLNTNKLTLNNTAAGAITAGSSTAYVVSESNIAINTSVIQWKMGATTGAHVFPFGVSGSYIPFTFNKTTAGSADISVSTRATATSDNTPWAGTSSVAAVGNMTSVFGGSAIKSVIDRWWDITASAAVTGNLTFSYRGSENTMTTSPTGSISAQHWDGTIWNTKVGSGTGVTSGVGTATVTGASTFSPWVLVASSQPLPIELISFDASCKDNEMLLNWTTASEQNNDYFTVEKSIDGLNFIQLKVVQGAGNSSAIKTYSMTDPAPYASTNYYRLKQTDFDGTVIYSNILAAEKCKSDKPTIAVSYKNDRNTLLHIVSDEAKAYKAHLIDATGQLLLTEKYDIGEGENVYELNTQKYKTGSYLIILDDGKMLTTRKIIMQ